MPRETHVSIKKFGGSGYHYHMTLIVIERDKDGFTEKERHEHKAYTRQGIKKQLQKWKRKHGKLWINQRDVWRNNEYIWFYKEGD